VAVELRAPKGRGRCRMRILADGSSASLHPFVSDHIEPVQSLSPTRGWSTTASTNSAASTTGETSAVDREHLESYLNLLLGCAGTVDTPSGSPGTNYDGRVLLSWGGCHT
jgi:hypothetical protein